MSCPFVAVDWRPGELPEVFGPFDTFEAAESGARAEFGVEDGADLPDGIVVRPLNPPATRE